MIKFQFTTKQEDYYKNYLNVLNVFLPKKLTNKEIDMVACILTMELLETLKEKDKKILSEKLNCSESNVYNYLKSLIEKGYMEKMRKDIS